MKQMFKVLWIFAAMMLVASSSYAAKRVHWRVALSWPSTLTPLSSPPIKLAKLVKKMTNGKFIIKVEGAEKTKSALGVFDMVKGGAYQMGHTGSYYYIGKDINTVWFTTVPWGMTKAEQDAWYYYGNGMKYMEKVYGKYGMLAFPGGKVVGSEKRSTVLMI